MSINARVTSTPNRVNPYYSWVAEGFDTETGAGFVATGPNPEEALDLLTEQVREYVSDGRVYDEYVYNHETGEFE